jgi:hypothetical protein
VAARTNDDDRAAPQGQGRYSQVAQLWQILHPCKLRFTFAPLATSIATGSVLALGNALKHVIDQGFGSGNAAAPQFALKKTNPSHHEDTQDTGLLGLPLQSSCLWAENARGDLNAI